MRKVLLFLSLSCFLSLFLYAAGTGQGFTGGNQLFLLHLALVTGLLLGLGSLYGMIGQIRSIILLPLPGKFLSLLCLASGAAAGAGTAASASFIIAAAGGNMP
ncbi:MAG: hypothetical protein LBS06_03995 [Treponema sp.]|jgi:hypothetical protein|nr:hypothetical protein [Treponema sp.]